MRLRANKLVYLPVGGALAAGLLVSAFVLPQPQLAASQSCYGVCGTATSLSLSRSVVTLGQEQLQVFSVRVSPPAHMSGVPKGTVEVASGAQALCYVHLAKGVGHCSLSRRALGLGSYQVVARYGGSAGFAPSTSRMKHFTVVKARSQTTLSLSRSVVTVGTQQLQVFHVRVRPAAGVVGLPTGTVEVKAGSKSLCGVNLSNGAGECSPSGRPLAPGSYEVVARYSGNADFKPSVSPAKHLNVRAR